MHQIRFRLGLRPRPRWVSLRDSAPDLLAGFKGPTCKGREERRRSKGGEGKWDGRGGRRKGKGRGGRRKGRGREGGEEKGKRRGRKGEGRGRDCTPFLKSKYATGDVICGQRIPV